MTVMVITIVLDPSPGLAKMEVYTEVMTIIIVLYPSRQGINDNYGHNRYVLWPFFLVHFVLCVFPSKLTSSVKLSQLEI